MLFTRLSDRPALRTGVVAGTVLVLAALTVVTWYGWLGRDHEYQIDPVTGVESGPYEAWQVIGCVLTLLGLALVTVVLTRPWLLFVIALALTLAWSVDAAGQDETGLWGVGAIMVLIGSLGAATVLVVLANALQQSRVRRRA